MLGFSIQKLLFTAFAIFAVWYGFKWVGRVQALRRERARLDAEAEGKVVGTEEMIQCRACDSFVPAAGAVSCGRDNCPYPG